MSHVIVVTQEGTGIGGSAKATVEYKPSHDTPPSEQLRRVRKVERVLKRLNDFLYNDGIDPYPDEHEE